MMLWNPPKKKTKENKEKAQEPELIESEEKELFLHKEIINLKHNVEINNRILEQRIDNICSRLDRIERKIRRLKKE